VSGIVQRVLLYTAVGLVASTAHAADARFYLATRSVPDYVEPDARGAALWGTVQSFYRARDYRLAWVQDGRMSAEAEQVAGMVARAETEGLDAYRVPASGPQAVTAAFNGAAASDGDAVWDVQLTYLFLRYAADLSGRFDPKAAGPFWLTRPPPRDLASWLEESLRLGHAGERFATLSPSHSAYRGLKAALERYRRIERDGGWPTLPPRLALRRGSRGPAVALLRRRLEVEGDLPSTTIIAAARAVYDSALAEGVKRFERRHGLMPDGILDAAAIEAMNVPVAARIRQIELNLERWRWLPADLGPRYVMVDLPSFQLTARADGRPAVTMKVVTGKADSPTPVFSNDMTTVVFSPYWNVPSTIAEDEIIPAVLRDPGYLRRHDLELFRGTQAVGPAALRGGDVSIRQRPGTRNALGLIKFVFPNPFGVYLHDTPSETLFARPRRAFSHGCIRVEKPRELAAWVLSGLPQWTPAAIGSAMRGGRERSLSLPEPIPVYITYETARADADGTVCFWPDVYGHDAGQMPLMPAHRALPSRPSTLGT
jgi:murein L,D-transpeptidase YcbB/YkuD